MKTVGSYRLKKHSVDSHILIDPETLNIYVDHHDPGGPLPLFNGRDFSSFETALGVAKNWFRQAQFTPYFVGGVKWL